MIATGLDRLLERPGELAGRRYALLTHGAAVSRDLLPAHLALSRAGAPPPTLLLAPEHGLFGVEQDMVPAVESRDPWTGVAIVSLYRDSTESLRPASGLFAGLDLLLIDLQDIGSRYYTYAASAAWTAEAALAAGLEVWVLDRPNPLGGEVVEGNRLRPAYGSFVGAFEIPVRHGLTLAELLRLEGSRRGWPDGLRAWPLAGWRRAMTWEEVGRPWVAPSPNMPTPATALLYPGMCLVEATRLSEGRGTTRPFHLVGAPGLDPVALADRLAQATLAGVAFAPTYFRPQFQKHAGQVCGGVEVVVTDGARFRSLRCGVELLRALAETGPGVLEWRREPYEFERERPAVDLLAGDDALRRALEGEGDLDAWIATWDGDEEAFRAERESILLYGGAGS